MPIQLEWQPNTQPVARGQQIGLLLYGDDSSLSSASNGRIRLVEIAGKGASSGVAESQTERLIASFHGKIHRDPSAPVTDRLTFEILKSSGDAAHEGSVLGFNPECMFGVDFFLLTFVNREFVVWFPFHTDVRSEGDFLEMVAVAEVEDPARNPPFREIGRSMVRTLTNREASARTVETTSTNPQTQQLVRYTAKVVGYNIAIQEDYLLQVGTRNAQLSTASDIVLDPALVPAPTTGPGAIQFAQYTAGNLRIVLMINLLDELIPDQAFAKNNFPFRDPNDTINIAKAEFKNGIPPRLVQIFEDAGFDGVTARWQDDQTAAQLVTNFTQRFIDRGSARGGWQLRSATAPLETSFWNFFIVHSPSLPVAARAEERVSALNKRVINGTEVFLQDNVPIGGGQKRIREPVRISSQIFQRILTTDPATNQFRQHRTIDDYKAAAGVVARKVAATVAHEVAHTLGMMHTVRTAATGTLSEKTGAPVLTVTSEDLRSHIGATIRFSMQAKVIWGRVFGVNPTFNDTSLVNKSWKESEVATVKWNERRTRFLTIHGETRPVALPAGLIRTTVPPFAVAPPGKPQRGTR